MATKIYLGNPPENIVNWIKAEAERKQQEMLITPLHFTANEPNSSVCLIAYDETLNDWYGGQCDSWCSFVYSTDKMKTWNDYTVGQIIYLDECENKTVYIQAKYNNEEDNPNINGLATYSYDETYGYYQFDNIYHKFIIEGSVKASGNIQFLLDNTGSRCDVPAFCYYHMFVDCRTLTQAPGLPADVLAEQCYAGMFSGCSSLTKAPELPTIIHLYEGCCQGMFYNCKSPFTFPNKTFDEMVDLIQYESMLGYGWWCDENYNTINPIEIICSDKTMLATFDDNEWTWTITEK